mgnify:CR=1 FL=1
MSTEAESEPKATDLAAVWGLPLMAVHCPSCDQVHLVPEEAAPQPCPFCRQGPVAPQPAYLRDEPPEQVVPYRITEGQLESLFEKWARGLWFRPPEMEPRLLAHRTRRYLIPLWLVDGQVEASWRADVGFNYQVVSSQDSYSERSGWSSQQVTETRVRWEPRLGYLKRTYNNLPAPALEDHRQLMARLGAYDLGVRSAYQPEAVQGAAVRIPTLDPQAAWPGAEVAFVRAAEDECRQAAGADHIRDFAMEAQYHDLNWTQLLLPAYVTWYREGGRIWPLLINGQSGKVSGVRRVSVQKASNAAIVMGLVALLILCIGGLLALLGIALPPAGVVGALVMAAGGLLALAAPIPPIWAWMANRRSEGT